MPQNQHIIRREKILNVFRKMGPAKVDSAMQDRASFRRYLAPTVDQDDISDYRLLGAYAKYKEELADSPEELEDAGPIQQPADPPPAATLRDLLHTINAKLDHLLQEVS